MFSTLLLSSLLLGNVLPDEGSIDGIVLNGSANRSPVVGADVVLRARLEGEFQSVAETTTDDHGRFSFDSLPIDETIVYLPGANREGVHYPGQRVRPTPRQPHAQVELVVYNTVSHPCPLVIQQYDIQISSEPGVLRVREVLVIANPSSTTYVGRPKRGKELDDSPPVTLRLAIPPDFERVTFDKEFFGRQFSVINGTLATRIPWTPGRKELAFTYLLRNEKKHRHIQRQLDLPCLKLRVRVRTRADRLDEVSCNVASDAMKQNGEVLWESAGQTLPAGQIISVELGRLPVPWTAYGRPLAALALFAMIAVASLLMKRGKRNGARGEWRDATRRQGNTRQ